MYVYEGSASDTLTERARLKPAFSSRTALVAERAALRFVTEHPAGATVEPRAAVLRFGGFVAPGSTHTSEAWEMASKGQALVLGDLAGWTTFVHIADAAAAVVHALGVESGVYNVGATPTPKADWLTVMSDLCGRQVKAPPGLLRWALPRLAPVAGALERSFGLDSTRLRSTGWVPEFADAAAIWSEARVGSS